MRNKNIKMSVHLSLSRVLNKMMSDDTWSYTASDGGI